jgi:deoxyribodipyrimidine photo-lyase
MDSPMLPLLNLVWLKRDLRTADHEPLALAQAALLHTDTSAGRADEAVDYRIVYLFEPSLEGRPDASARHRRFVDASLDAMDRTLAPHGRRVDRMEGEAVEVFARWSRVVRLHTVFSYREHGVQATWDRDRAVARLFREQGVRWIELPRDGVLRGIQNRTGWDEAWVEAMQRPLVNVAWSPPVVREAETSVEVARREGPGNPVPRIPAQCTPSFADGELLGGEAEGWALLRGFLEGRGRGFRRSLGQPVASRITGSRISAHLAWGTLSLRQVVQASRGDAVRPPNEGGPLKEDLRSFQSRLFWRSHFIQKFEMECRYETGCLNRGYESVPRTPRPDWVMAWAEGRTGFPMVDAAMRCLAATGWINFRLRALLVSFLTHHLFQDWRAGAPHLARLFLDFEPGIHYPQFQMQAGVTGTNTIRIYNPVKQSLELDPAGEFIARWVPEIAPLPTPWRHEPWRTPPLEAAMAGVDLNAAYPPRLVDHEGAARHARDLLWGWRDRPEVRSENRRIERMHLRAGGR